MPIDQMLLNRLKDNDLTLTELDLSYQILTAQHMQALVQALATNTTCSGQVKVDKLFKRNCFSNCTGLTYFNVECSLLLL